jgi:hypothetical protein
MVAEDSVAMGLLKRLNRDRRARVVAAVVLGAVVAAVLAWLRTREEEELEPARGPLVGTKAPGVADNVEFWLNGEEVELPQLKGRPVLLVFWHPRDDGKRSLAAIPHIRDLADSYAGRGLVTIGFCVLDGPEEAEPILAEHGITFLTGLDCDADLHIDYRIDKMGTPYCYLVDANGAVAWEGPPEQLSVRRIRDHLP